MPDDTHSAARSCADGANSSPRVRALFAAAAVAALLVTVAGCGGGQAAASGPPKGDPKAAQGPPALVRVAPVEARAVRPKVAYVGSVLPHKTSVVASGSDGQVEKFLVDEGEFVEKNAVLSELRMISTDLEIDQARSLLREREEDLREMEAGSREEDKAEARAKMLMAKAVMENTAARLKRVQAIMQRNAGKQEDLDEAIEKAEAARQAHAAAKAMSERTDKGPREEQIEQARARVKGQKEHIAWLLAEREKRITRAPFDGFVVREKTYLGQWLSKGDPVVELAKLDEVDVVVNVDQTVMDNIRLKDKAAVRVTGCAQRDWTGTIEAIVPRSDWEGGSRGFPVKVRLTNRIESSDGRTVPVLMAGMMAEVTFEGPPVEALMVPKDALVRTSRGMLIYLFVPGEGDKPGSVRMVPVATGISEGNDIQVTGEGVAAGMHVVKTGAERLRPFQDAIVAPETP